MHFNTKIVDCLPIEIYVDGDKLLATEDNNLRDDGSAGSHWEYMLMGNDIMAPGS